MERMKGKLTGGGKYTKNRKSRENNKGGKEERKWDNRRINDTEWDKRKADRKWGAVW